MAKVNWGPIALGGGLLLLLLGAGGTAAAKTGRDPRPDLELPPLPGPDELDQVIASVCNCADALQGMTGDTAGALLECVALDLFPDVPWPPIEGDNPSIWAWWEFLAGQVAEFMANPDAYCLAPKPEPEPEPAPDFGDLVRPWISETPKPGTFYQIKKGDELVNIARAALNATVGGAGQNNAARLDYVYCITSGPRWNATLYGSPSFTDPGGSFGPSYGVNGIGLRRAFFPWHENALAALLSGRKPTRAIDLQGGRIPGVGSRYGLLWLPPVDEENLAEFGEPTCAPYNWSDGSSSIDPPSEILNALAVSGIQQGQG